MECAFSPKKNGFKILPLTGHSNLGFHGNHCFKKVPPISLFISGFSDIWLTTMLQGATSVDICILKLIFICDLEVNPIYY